ncbi:MAG: DNA/RNA non-specific endonuclease [Muribaculaceae bacterium]|nr:DNA/RNA non-specific endonuclease [Muribaculaceae bacterium]
MDKNKILKYAAVFLLIIGIAYLWNRLSTGAIDKAFDTPQQTASSNHSIDLTTLDKVTSAQGVPAVFKEYEGFTVSFNPENKTPNYVSWILHGRKTGGKVERSNKFWTDTDIDGCPDTRDYSRSGYDRGHMCPAGEQKWSDKAMHDCFVMTNMCPQNHELNKGAWNTLEEMERVWAKRDSAIVIVAGPIYDGTETETIGLAEVRVPSAFFKVLLAPFAEPMRAIGFVYPNMKCEGNMQAYAVSVDEVEKMTGFDFFTMLPDEIENDIEASVSFREWNSRLRKDRKAEKEKEYEHHQR